MPAPKSRKHNPPDPRLRRALPRKNTPEFVWPTVGTEMGERGVVVPKSINDNGEQTHASRLKEIRIRSGLYASVIAKHLGYSGPAAVYTWERPYKSPKSDLFYDRPINSEFIRKTLSLFVGRGKPQITEKELLALCDPLDAATMTGITRAGAAEAAMALKIQAETKPLKGQLAVRYRAESGVFVDESSLDRRAAGAFAPLVGVPAQECAAVVADDHARPHFPQGSVLHVRRTDDYRGQFVLVKAAHDTGKDLYEVVVARVDLSGNLLSLRNVPLRGEPVGAIVGHYTPAA